jgi:hypothetical protein
LRLGIQLDYSDENRVSYVDAVFESFLRRDNEPQLSVPMIAPETITKGEANRVQVKLGPSITLASGAGASLFEIGGEFSFGQVAPIVTGYTDPNEMYPYWRLKNHRDAPLIGRRHFWALVELPPNSSYFDVSCKLSVSLQTPYGKLRFEPLIKEWLHRKRQRINIKLADK